MFYTNNAIANVFVRWLLVLNFHFLTQLIILYFANRYSRLWSKTLVWIALTPLTLLGIFAIPTPPNFGDENFLALLMVAIFPALILFSNILFTILIIIDSKRFKKSGLQSRVGLIAMSVFFIVSLYLSAPMILGFHQGANLIEQVKTGSVQPVKNELNNDYNSFANKYLADNYNRTLESDLETYAELAKGYQGGYYAANNSSFVNLRDCLVFPSKSSCLTDYIATTAKNYRSYYITKGDVLTVNSSDSSFCISQLRKSNPPSYACVDNATKESRVIIGPNSDCGVSGLVCPK